MTGHDVWADSLQSKLFEEKKLFAFFCFTFRNVFSFKLLKTIFQLSENQTEIVIPFGNFYRTFCISVRKQSMMRSTLPQKPSTRRRRWVFVRLGGARWPCPRWWRTSSTWSNSDSFSEPSGWPTTFMRCNQNNLLDIFAPLLNFDQIKLRQCPEFDDHSIWTLPIQTFNYIDSDGTHIISKENFLEEDTKWGE